jgi:hypothetical protein
MNTNNNLLAKIYLFAIFFTPSFFGYISLNLGQMIYLSIFFSISIIFSLPFLCYGKIVNIKTSLQISLLIFICYTISTIFNFNLNKPKANDVIEIYRPLIYFFSFFFSIIILRQYVEETGALKCLDCIDNLIFYSSFIEFLKYIDITKNFFYMYTPFPYGSINYMRLSGFTGFAYSYAWILLIGMIFCIVKSQGRIQFRFIYYSLLVCLTGSRSGLLSLVVLYVFLSLSFKEIKKQLFYLFIGLSLLIGCLYFFDIPIVVISVDYIIGLILAFLGKGDDGSLATRSIQIMEALKRFYDSPLYGSGSNKMINPTIENFYFHHLATWGIAGLVLYFFWLYSFTFYLSSKYAKKIFFLILLVSCLISFSTPIFDQIRIFNIFYAIVAILIIDENRASVSITKSALSTYSRC